MNQLTDTQAKNLHFVLANLWDRSRGRCPPILEKISWKQSKISHFSIFKRTNEPTDRPPPSPLVWQRSKLFFCFFYIHLPAWYHPICNPLIYLISPLDERVIPENFISRGWYHFYNVLKAPSWFILRKWSVYIPYNTLQLRTLVWYN